MLVPQGRKISNFHRSGKVFLIRKRKHPIKATPEIYSSITEHTIPDADFLKIKMAMFPHSIIMAVNIGLAKRSAKDTLARATYNDFISNDAGNFEKAEKAKFDDTVGSETPTPKRWRSG